LKQRESFGESVCKKVSFPNGKELSHTNEKLQFLTLLSSEFARVGVIKEKVKSCFRNLESQASTHARHDPPASLLVGDTGRVADSANDTQAARKTHRRKGSVGGGSIIMSARAPTCVCKSIGFSPLCLLRPWQQLSFHFTSHFEFFRLLILKRSA